MSTIHTASRQWASRPSDERFTSLTALNDAVHYFRQNASGKVLPSRSLECVPVEGDSKALKVIGPNGSAVDVTNYAFGQLATRAGAPAGYLRTLPAALAADNVNFGLQHVRDREDLGVLLYKGDGAPQLRAVTGPAYGRVWNSKITSALVDRFGDGINGDFRVPGEFGKAVNVTKENTTLYASDRDMFVFLADEQHRITVPNRRDGKSGDLARGFFVWNSEVGATTFGIATFLFDYVCCNRIVWGAQEYAEIKIRHTASAPDRWLEEVVPAIESYANSSSQSVVLAIEDAKKNRIENVDTFLATRKFTQSQINAVKAAHVSDEGRPIENLWDCATGITAYARELPFQDERVKLERAAGKVLDLAHA